MKILQQLAAAVATVSLLIAGTAGSAFADDDLSHKRSSLENQLQATAKQRDDLESALEDLSGELVQTQVDLQAVQAQIPAAQAALTQATTVLDEPPRRVRRLTVVRPPPVA